MDLTYAALVFGLAVVHVSVTAAINIGYMHERDYAISPCIELPTHTDHFKSCGTFSRADIYIDNMRVQATDDGKHYAHTNMFGTLRETYIRICEHKHSYSRQITPA